MTFQTKRDLYDHVWATRHHISEISGDPLLPKNHPQWHWQMCHILPHGNWKAYKFRPENIILMTVDEHSRQESIPEFRRRYEELKRRYYAEIYGKSFD